jgi:hypothetical protein
MFHSALRYLPAKFFVLYSGDFEAVFGVSQNSTLWNDTVPALVRGSELLLTQSHFRDDGILVHVHMTVTGLCLTTMRHKTDVGGR